MAMNVLLSVEYACSTSLHPCHPNATCIDVFGLLGFVQCKCKPGYNQTASYQTFANNRLITPDGTYCPSKYIYFSKTFINIDINTKL